jgi:hypothetical protein
MTDYTDKKSKEKREKFNLDALLDEAESSLLPMVEFENEVDAIDRLLMNTGFDLDDELIGAELNKDAPSVINSSLHDNLLKSNLMQDKQIDGDQALNDLSDFGDFIKPEVITDDIFSLSDDELAEPPVEPALADLTTPTIDQGLDVNQALNDFSDFSDFIEPEVVTDDIFSLGDDELAEPPVEPALADLITSTIDQGLDVDQALNDFSDFSDFIEPEVVPDDILSLGDDVDELAMIQTSVDSVGPNTHIQAVIDEAGTANLLLDTVKQPPENKDELDDRLNEFDDFSKQIEDQLAEAEILSTQSNLEDDFLLPDFDISSDMENSASDIEVKEDPFADSDFLNEDDATVDNVAITPDIGKTASDIEIETEDNQNPKLGSLDTEQEDLKKQLQEAVDKVKKAKLLAYAALGFSAVVVSAAIGLGAMTYGAKSEVTKLTEVVSTLQASQGKGSVNNPNEEINAIRNSVVQLNQQIDGFISNFLNEDDALDAFEAAVGNVAVGLGVMSYGAKSEVTKLSEVVSTLQASLAKISANNPNEEINAIRSSVAQLNQQVDGLIAELKENPLLPVDLLDNKVPEIVAKQDMVSKALNTLQDKMSEDAAIFSEHAKVDVATAKIENSPEIALGKAEEFRALTKEEVAHEPAMVRKDSTYGIVQTKEKVKSEITLAKTKPEILAAKAVAKTEIVPTKVVAKPEVVPAKVIAKAEIPAVKVDAKPEVVPAKVIAKAEIPAAKVDAKPEVVPAKVVAKAEIPAVKVDTKPEVVPAKVVAKAEIPTVKVDAKPEVVPAKVQTQSEVVAVIPKVVSDEVPVKLASSETASHWGVNLVAFKQEWFAKSKAAEFARQGILAEVIPIPGNMYRVRVGGFKSKAEANANKGRIQSALNLGNVWVSDN